MSSDKPVCLTCARLALVPDVKSEYALPIQIRMCQKYKTWRRKVLQRDRYTCRTCGELGPVTHHIKPLLDIMYDNRINNMEQANNCQELWNISNGVTLCKECHFMTRSEQFATYLYNNLPFVMLTEVLG